MKSKLFSSIASLLITVTFAQQKLIAIKGTTTDAIATTLTEAITLAQPNDKIYLPGGNFDFTGTIDKPIHIIGIGFQNGLNVDGFTNISGNLNINSLANGSVFEGFHLTDYFINQDQNNIINNITFKRCNFKGISGTPSFKWDNCIVLNCVVREYLIFASYQYSFGTNNLISNSIIYYVERLGSSTIKNCIIGNHINPISTCDNLSIKNNIFIGDGSYSCNISPNSSNIIYFNNLIISACNNIVNQIYYNNDESPFVNGGPTFNSLSDYQLENTSSGNNAGDDGTDVGIYGGQYPWKNGSLPVSPTIEQNNSFLDVQNEQFKLRVKVVPQTN